MKETLLEILNNYLSAKNTHFAGNILASFIRQTAPPTISAKAAITTKYKIQGSAGQATWAEIPWISIFDSQITTSAQKGYYIVYLFRSDMSGVYLSLNMGWTQFERKFKSIGQAQQMILDTAVACRELIRSSLTEFSYEPIDLITNRNLGKGYELGHICGKLYSKDYIPDDRVLVDDLRNLIGVYRELRGHVNRKEITNLAMEYLKEQAEREDWEDVGYQAEVAEAAPIDIPITPQEKPEHIEVKGREKWKTNPGHAKACLINSRYKCEVNPDHQTFISQVTNNNYVEAHHLIPMEFQERFLYSLDIPANIMSMCPNCHKLLHHARHIDKVKLLSLLLEKRRDALENAGISLSLSDLTWLYK